MNDVVADQDCLYSLAKVFEWESSEKQKECKHLEEMLTGREESVFVLLAR